MKVIEKNLFFTLTCTLKHFYKHKQACWTTCSVRFLVQLLPHTLSTSVPLFNVELKSIHADMCAWGGDMRGNMFTPTEIVDCQRLVFKTLKGGWNSSVGSAWARCPQRRGFDPPLGTFSVKGIFPLELTWVQTPFPPPKKNSFGWEYKPRSSLCIHAFHRTDSKDPDVHVLDGWMPATKTHPARTIHEDGMWLP